MWSIYLLELLNKGKDGYRLYGLAKTHVVSQDATDAALIKTDHPVESYELIIFEESALEDGWLLSQPCKDILFLLFFLHHYLDFLVLFVKVPSFLWFNLVVLAQDLMLRQ